MRFEITGKWNNDFSHDGLLYCVQRIEEMLFAYTSHLYKVPVYNSFLLAYEFLNVYNQVENDLIDQIHLKIILEEFISTFESDIVIKEHLSEQQIAYFKGRLTGGSNSDRRKTMNYLVDYISDYPSWCVETLKKSIRNSKEKKKIERAIRSFLPMIIGMGYHPHFIYRECKYTFTQKNIIDINCFDEFLREFEWLDKDYKVYFAVDKRISIFKTILEERLGLSFEQDDYSEQFRFNNERCICVHMSVSALDPNGAARKVYDNFDLFTKYYRFLGNRNIEFLGNTCLVLKDNGETVFPHIGQEKYFFSQDYDDMTLGINSERVITKLLRNAGGNDFFRIDKVIRSHNAAISSQDINNAFLNLWSIMEIVGVDGYDGNTSRIKQVINSIVPILKRNYINRIAEEIHDYVKGNLDASDYNELIIALSENGTEEYKIACLLSLEKYADVRKKAFSMLENYPLIRSRISQLYEDVFKKKKKYIAELNRYEQRITWHIQRLYRVRNSIIHSGDESENIVFLVEHLHSYVDEIILDLINRMTREQSLGSVSNVLIDAQVFIERINKEFNNEESFSPEDIKILML